MKIMSEAPTSTDIDPAMPSAFQDLEIVYLPLDDIHEYEGNPRKNDEAVEKVAKSIQRHGMSAPISVDADHTIIYGHTRYKACRQLGMKSVPCIIRTDLSPELVRSLRLADNKVGEASGWDSEKLLHELEELTAEGLDMSQFGFVELMSEEEIDAFFDPAEEKPPAPKMQSVTCPKCGEVFEVEVEK